MLGPVECASRVVSCKVREALQGELFGAGPNACASEMLTFFVAAPSDKEGGHQSLLSVQLHVVCCKAVCGVWVECIWRHLKCVLGVYDNVIDKSRA